MVIRALAAAAVLLFAGTAAAIPVDSGTRIAVSAGYQYIPNARFLSQAEGNGHPVASHLSGGPTGLATFGYRPMLELEISIELGGTFEQYKFVEGQTMAVVHLPVLVMARWSPFGVGTWTPYLAAGGGYVLNFFGDSPVGPVESHGAGPVLGAGFIVDLSEKFALTAEYRVSFIRVGVPGLGFANTSGSTALVGIQYSFPPEDTRLH